MKSNLFGVFLLGFEKALHVTCVETCEHCSLQNLFRQQQKLFQQSRVVQGQRLKTMRQLHEQFMKVRWDPIATFKTHAAKFHACDSAASEGNFFSWVSTTFGSQKISQKIRNVHSRSGDRRFGWCFRGWMTWRSVTSLCRSECSRS